MRQYQRADPDATTQLIRQVSPLLLRFLINQCRNAAEAEDLLQDTWLRIHKSRHTYREGEPVLPWMFAIARHVKVDGYRRFHRIHSRERVMFPLPEPPQPSGAPIAAIPDFGTLIAALPASQREVVSMLKVSGMSLEEVARATASSVGSVKLKAHRAYQKLRSILQAGAGENLVRSSDDVV